MTDLRRRLRKGGVEYLVIKNTLALRAVNESGLMGTRLRGPTGIVIAKDPVTAAKVLTDFAKEFEKLTEDEVVRFFEPYGEWAGLAGLHALMAGGVALTGAAAQQLAA